MSDTNAMNSLVDRFLGWPLPDSVCSDLCATTPGYPHRTGTTLLTAVEAEMMLRHVVGPELDSLRAENAKANVELAALRGLVEKARPFIQHREECDHNYGDKSYSDDPMLGCDCGLAEWEARTRE